MRKVIVFENKNNRNHFLASEIEGDISLEEVNSKNTLMLYKKDKDAKLSWLKSWILFWERHTEYMTGQFGKDYVQTFDWENILDEYNITMIEVDENKLLEDNQ